MSSKTFKCNFAALFLTRLLYCDRCAVLGKRKRCEICIFHHYIFIFIEHAYVTHLNFLEQVIVVSMFIQPLVHDRIATANSMEPRCCSSSEANACEKLEYHEELFHWYYIHFLIFSRFTVLSILEDRCAFVTNYT